MFSARAVLPLLALLLTCGSLKSQTVLSVELQQELSTQILQILLPVLTPDYPINTYKVIYTGQDPFGETDTLSGMLAIPQDADNPAFPMLSYMHGTAFAPDAVPSEQGVEERRLVFAFASKGYISIAPDYLGYGVDSLELHPYVHADTEGQAGYDMLVAVQAWLEEEGIAYNDQLFLTGYSQGGHASAAMQKVMEADSTSDITVTAAAHLSGPYAISESMRQAVINPGLSTFPAYIVYTYVGYRYVYGLYEDNEAIFVEPYLSTIDSFTQGLTDLEELNGSLFQQLEDNNALLDALFQDSIITILEENDPEHPIIAALLDNDLYNFVPLSPTRLYYCTEDEQVPFQNALLADTVMNALGAEDVASVNGGPNDHGGCVIPAALYALSFFEQFQEILSSTDDLVRAEPGWQLAPNPVSSGGLLRLLVDDTSAPAQYILSDLQGRQLATGQVPANREFRLRDLPPGTYIVQLILDDRVAVRRLLVR